MLVVGKFDFPQFTGVRCLMMPFIQGDPDSVPDEYRRYSEFISRFYLEKGEIGFLTIDESEVQAGKPHRGARAKYGRALHTEAGKKANARYGWGDTGGDTDGGTYTWGDFKNVLLDPDCKMLIGSNSSNTCAVWDATHEDTSFDGDIGNFADKYPYEEAIVLSAGEICQIGILTPHESLPVQKTHDRQFVRIVGSGVKGREPYFTINPLVQI